jgi:nucleotide-binding universal stress UspA family protein
MLSAQAQGEIPGQGANDRHGDLRKEEKMISRILVPTDGSETAAKAVKYAADLALKVGAEVILLGVIENNFYAVPSMPGAVVPNHLIEPVEEYIRTALTGMLAETENVYKQCGIPVKTVIRSGYPVEEILREAEKSKADLIVIGSHGKSALKAALLGSVTFGVIHKDSKVPVLVVRK